MRSFRTLLALSGAFTLAACGGDSAPQSVGTIAPPAGTPTPTHSFVNPTEAKTYDGLGTVQHYEYYTDSGKSGQGGQLYGGDANTVRDSGISLTYNPRDAIFELTISRPNGFVNFDFRYQDPLHRTAFGGPREPQGGTPEFDASRQIQYLEGGTLDGEYLSPNSPFYTVRDANGNVVSTAANSDYPVHPDGSTSTRQTFFYQKPGTTTKYVTYAGFVRNTVTGASQSSADPAQGNFLRESYSIDRAAFVFGEKSTNAAVPRTGTGTFSGEMIASMVVNVDPTSRADSVLPSYIQWMQGRQESVIDFAALTVKSRFEGSLLAPALDAYTSGKYVLGAGTRFSATGSATIDMVNRGGFTGRFDQACFAVSCTAANALVIAGSSLDGTFYGPNAEEIGGGFRIVGGTPDQRIDILGAFTGRK